VPPTADHLVAGVTGVVGVISLGAGVAALCRRRRRDEHERYHNLGPPPGVTERRQFSSVTERRQEIP
jgi:hypothetical protein